MRVVLLLLLSFQLFAQVSLEELQHSPKGHVRNFYIWQYMQGDISSENSETAYGLMYKYNHKIHKLYIKKTKNKKVLEKERCSHLKTSSLLQEDDATCVSTALSYSRAMDLNNVQRQKLSLKLQKAYPKKSERIALMNKKPFILGLLQSGNENYVKLFNSVGTKYRRRYFNIKLPPERINELAKVKGFNLMVRTIVMDKLMFRMQDSLLGLTHSELNDKSYFFLALNALHFKATNKAMMYLELSQKKAYFRIDQDKSVFWMYLISKDKKYLKKLSLSSDINMYTLYANEKLGIEVKNYFCKRDLKDKESCINLNNPYVWEKALNEVRDANVTQLEGMLEKFNTKDDEAINAFIYARSLKYKQHNYIMPYKKVTDELSNDDKALLYALAKQESQFIPSALSRSYALGVMQMMPFLVDALAKQKKEEVELNEMFNPYKNITYSKKHIRWIKKSLYHPLFIAYAYNGGMGFTRRHLETGTFTKGSFEPFLSMELMSNTESREYGKKVLANYVIYKKILGEEVSIIELFDKLTNPLETDRFRPKYKVKR